MIVLVTGATAGFGECITRRFIESGHKVIATGRRQERLQELKDELGNNLYTAQLDVRNRASIEEMLDALPAEWRNIDILVNNAGTIRRQDALDFSEKDWDDVMNLNLKSVFFLSQAVARQFLVQGNGGKIINIASMLSFQGGIRVPSYTASKSGVLGITRLLANEWAAQGINVNAIAPGYMATNNTQQLREDSTRNQQIVDRIPAGRWGTPDDLKGPVVFLASAASDYIHGYTLAVDGGWLAR